MGWNALLGGMCVAPSDKAKLLRLRRSSIEMETTSILSQPTVASNTSHSWPTLTSSVLTSLRARTVISSPALDEHGSLREERLRREEWPGLQHEKAVYVAMVHCNGACGHANQGGSGDGEEESKLLHERPPL